MPELMARIGLRCVGFPYRSMGARVNHFGDVEINVGAAVEGARPGCRRLPRNSIAALPGGASEHCGSAYALAAKPYGDRIRRRVEYLRVFMNQLRKK